MWLFTKHGFFSVVCARQGNGEYGAPVDHDRMMVRARVRPHLESLQAVFPELLGGIEIHDSPRADYAHRIFVPKDIWLRVLGGLGEELDYDNFKSEVAQHLGRAGAAYEHALHEVWEVMYGLQQGQVARHERGPIDDERGGDGDE